MTNKESALGKGRSHRMFPRPLGRIMATFLLFLLLYHPSACFFEINTFYRKITYLTRHAVGTLGNSTVKPSAFGLQPYRPRSVLLRYLNSQVNLFREDSFMIFYKIPVA